MLPPPASAAARAARAARAGLSVQDAILAGVLDPLLIIDGLGAIERASGSVVRVFGWEPSELVGRNIKILMPEPYRSEHDGYLASYRETGKSALLGKTREFPIVRKDGVVIVCEMSVSRVDVPGRRPAVHRKFSRHHRAEAGRRGSRTGRRAASAPC
jgi:PAS domain S-box-containing protein